MLKKAGMKPLFDKFGLNGKVVYIKSYDLKC